ncbi:hypothetical protein Tdes44962_MAKER08069 [Teratosphaeria destructans]|uniref:Secreted protein n=1 Tax=Teratosphaeria destructans TaxID=418781 RepID=A0A9W7SXK5_9PEZI|nr:hypothetical protein Tdes44962_MAKER08069 [Teratosphaeria destructans]
MLPGHPLLYLTQLWVLCECEFVLGVIVPRHVAQNSCALLNRQSTIIVVDQHWNASIWTKSYKPGFFLNVLANVDALEDIVWLAICFLDLFENDGGFVA